MSFSPGDTVKVRLDPVEYGRLKKIRARLKLTKWTDIEECYLLEPDEKVNTWLWRIKEDTPEIYDEKFTNWKKRFSDFDLVWTKKQYATELHGALCAGGFGEVQTRYLDRGQESI